MGPQQMTVGLIADPGFPLSIAERLAGELPDALSRQVTGCWSWNVRAIGRRLEADANGEVRLHAVADQAASPEFDVVVFLSDQPRRSAEGPIVAEVSAKAGVALALLPALGAMRVRSRARSLVVGLIDELVANRSRGGRRPTGSNEDDRVGVRVVRRGALRLVGGIVRANRP